MISFADFELAIARWKTRTSGTTASGEIAVSGAVTSEVPNATAPEDSDYAVDVSSGYSSSTPQAQASGSIVISDSLREPPQSE
jgi:hypothetical protein